MERILENPCLRITVDPACGGRVTGFFAKKTAREFFWFDRSRPPADPALDYDGNFAGGMDELLPCDLPEVPWPDGRATKEPGQVNAFCRWENVMDRKDRFKIALFLLSKADVTTKFSIPEETSTTVSLRRLQRFFVQPREKVRWRFGKQHGEVCADETGLVTIHGLHLTGRKEILELFRKYKERTEEGRS